MRWCPQRFKAALAAMPPACHGAAPCTTLITSVAIQQLSGLRWKNGVPRTSFLVLFS
jgi:hypothetical protein